MLPCNRLDKFLLSDYSNRIASCPTRNSSSYNLGRQDTGQDSQNSHEQNWNCSFCGAERNHVANSHLGIRCCLLVDVENEMKEVEVENRFVDSFRLPPEGTQFVR